VRHQLALQVRVGIVLADVVAVVGDRLVGREALEPVVDVGDQAALVARVELDVRRCARQSAESRDLLALAERGDDLDRRSWVQRADADSRTGPAPAGIR
jgi:hypothetical protein